VKSEVHHRNSKALEELRTYRENHLRLGEIVLKADNGAIFPLDILVATIVYAA